MTGRAWYLHHHLFYFQYCNSNQSIGTINIKRALEKSVSLHATVKCCTILATLCCLRIRFPSRQDAQRIRSELDGSGNTNKSSDAAAAAKNCCFCSSTSFCSAPWKSCRQRGLGSRLWIKSLRNSVTAPFYYAYIITNTIRHRNMAGKGKEGLNILNHQAPSTLMGPRIIDLICHCECTLAAFLTHEKSKQSHY